MEDFVLPQGTNTLKDSRELLNNALLTVRSLSSGTSFPTSNLSVGMLCYRTDQNRLYQLTNVDSQTWTDKIQMNINGSSASCTGNAATATNAANADVAKKANECTGNAATATRATADENGNNIAETYATKQAVDNVSSDVSAGLADVEQQLNKYLPLTGGTLTGNLVFEKENADTNLYRKSKTHRMIVASAPTFNDGGARIYLHGADYDETNGVRGEFQIYAHDGTTSKQLRGRADGSLTWQGKNILTGNASVVETWESGANGYRVWSDGFIEQWGTTSAIDADSYTVTFSKAFTTTNYHVNFTVVGSTTAKDGSYGHQVTARTTANFTAYDFLMNNLPITWYACGF